MDEILNLIESVSEFFLPTLALMTLSFSFAIACTMLLAAPQFATRAKFYLSCNLFLAENAKRQV